MVEVVTIATGQKITAVKTKTKQVAVIMRVLQSVDILEDLVTQKTIQIANGPNAQVSTVKNPDAEV